VPPAVLSRSTIGWSLTPVTEMVAAVVALAPLSSVTWIENVSGTVWPAPSICTGMFEPFEPFSRPYV
jgi:hypothetical protein